MSANGKDILGIAEAVRAEALRRDRAVKLWLLAVSLATVGVLIYAAVEENLRPTWRRHQLEYGQILRQKAGDDWGRKLADQYVVELRQIVVADLGVMDRCVSCHTGYDDPRMTDVPNPYRTHPGAYLQWHEDARFGCTICHRGQGAATNFADAKAEDRHWDYPLLPLDLTQSSCGICHTPAEVAQRGGEVYARGAALFVSKGCRSCHKLDGLGGSLGPALDNEGLKVRGQLPFGHVQGPHTLAQWLIEHFDDPRQVVAGSQMPTPGLSRDERTALTAFLLSLQQRDLPKSYLSPLKHLALYRVQHPEPRSGDQLYADLCQSCHDTGIYGRYDKFFARFIPAIRGETYQRIAEPAYVAANIREGRAGTIMPAWGAAAGGLSEEEILRLASTLLGRELDATQTAATAPIRSHPRAARGDARRGTSLFAKQCSGCHGLSAEGRLGPSLVAPALQRYASDDFLYATIAFGRRNTAMPAFLAVAPAEGGFQEPQLDDLIAFLRRIGAPAGQDMTALSTTPSVAPRAPAAAPSAPDITAAAPAGAQTR